MESIKKYRTYILSEIVCVPLDIRKKRIEIHKHLCVQFLKCSWIMPLKGIDQKKGVSIDRDFRFVSVIFPTVYLVAIN